MLSKTFFFEREQEDKVRDEKTKTALLRACFDVQFLTKKINKIPQLDVSFFVIDKDTEKQPLRLKWSRGKEKGWYSFISRIQPRKIKDIECFQLELKSRDETPFVLLREYLEPHCGLLRTETETVEETRKKRRASQILEQEGVSKRPRTRTSTSQTK